MKTCLTTLLTGIFLLSVSLTAFADETITVNATNADISSNLDLKAVATVFGEAANLEEFEQKLNDPESRISNLDLNGDGVVDYLRVVESTSDNVHIVLVQAVLAKDIFQDVASIYVEKDEKNDVTVQVVGDEYIYGVNYIIEPVYITRPLLFDWFWGPFWTCWYSPYYWGYYPRGWWAYDCWLIHDYWHHIYAFHHHHPYCSYRHPHAIDPHFAAQPRPNARHDYAVAHPERSFSSRNTGRGATNARDLQPMRSVSSTRMGQMSGNRTFESSNVRRTGTTVNRQPATGPANTRSSQTSTTATRPANTTATRTAQPNATATRSAGNTPARSSQTSATVTRQTGATPSRATSVTSTRSSAVNTVSRSSSSATVTRPSTSTATRPATTSTATRQSSTSATVTRPSTSSTTTARPSSSSMSTRSSSSSTRTTSTPTRSSSSYSGGSYRSSGSSGGYRSSGSSSSPSRSSGSMGSPSRSSGSSGTSRGSGGGTSRR